MIAFYHFFNAGVRVGLFSLPLYAKAQWGLRWWRLGDEVHCEVVSW